MRYVSLFCTMLILAVAFLCVNLYPNKADRVGIEKEFSTADYLTWEDWTQGIRDYILGCSADGEGVAHYLSLLNPERGEKMVFDLGHAAWKEGRTGPRSTVYYAPNGVWVVERPYSFSLDCPQGVMTFCESMTMPEFIPWSDYDGLLNRFRCMENYYVDIAVESSLHWEQLWVPLMKLYKVVGMDRLITIYSWENVSFCRQCVSPARPPAPGAETEIVAVIQKLEELVNSNHKADSPEVQKLLEALYRLKQMYPLQFSDIIRTWSAQLQMVNYEFLKSMLNDGGMGEEN